MRKVLLAVSAFIFLLAAVNTHAQGEKYDFQRSYQDYVFTFDQYQKAHSDYKLARSQYLQAQTLVSETQAREKTATMLQARDDVIITYLNAVRLKLDEADGVGVTVKNGLLGRLESEVSWFENHKSLISSAGNLEDLVEDSEEAFNHYEETEKLVYETLIVVSNGKINVLRSGLSSILSDTRQKTFEINSKGDHDIDLASRWLDEIDEKITRSLDKSIEAETETQELYDKGGSKAEKRLETSNKIYATLQESQQLLRDGVRFMKEIIELIITV